MGRDSEMPIDTPHEDTATPLVRPEKCANIVLRNDMLDLSYLRVPDGYISISTIGQNIPVPVGCTRMPIGSCRHVSCHQTILIVVTTRI